MICVSTAAGNNHACKKYKHGGHSIVSTNTCTTSTSQVKIY